MGGCQQLPCSAVPAGAKWNGAIRVAAIPHGRLLRQKAPANILLVDAPVKFTHSGKHPFLHSKGALDYFIQGTQHE